MKAISGTARFTREKTKRYSVRLERYVESKCDAKAFLTCHTFEKFNKNIAKSFERIDNTSIIARTTGSTKYDLFPSKKIFNVEYHAETGLIKVCDYYVEFHGTCPGEHLVMCEKNLSLDEAFDVFMQCVEAQHDHIDEFYFLTSNERREKRAEKRIIEETM